jgi:hypothetical protein
MTEPAKKECPESEAVERESPTAANRGWGTLHLWGAFRNAGRPRESEESGVALLDGSYSSESCGPGVRYQR